MTVEGVQRATIDLLMVGDSQALRLAGPENATDLDVTALCANF